MASAAAALVYFDKAVNELTLAEAAYLAALPKAPNNYHPFRYPERAHRAPQLGDRPHGRERLRRPARRARPPRRRRSTSSRAPTGVQLADSEYFNEEVRRVLYERYGEKGLYEGGLSVRTTLDPQLQTLARKVLRDGSDRVRRRARLARPGARDRPEGRLGRRARRRAGARRRALEARRRAGRRRRARRRSACSRSARSPAPVEPRSRHRAAFRSRACAGRNGPRAPSAAAR